MIKNSREEDINRCNKLTASWVGLSNQLALKRVLLDYKRVLKENEELGKFITEGIEIKTNSPYKNYSLEFLRNNFIPIQKVKDKIEELQKTNFNDYTKKQDGNEVKMEILYEFKKMLESEE